MQLPTLLLLAVVPALALGAADSNSIPLAGSWAFQLDATGAGHAGRWQERKFGANVIFLPGSYRRGGLRRQGHGAGKGLAYPAL